MPQRLNGKTLARLSRLTGLDFIGGFAYSPRYRVLMERDGSGWAFEIGGKPPLRPGNDLAVAKWRLAKAAAAGAVFPLVLKLQRDYEDTARRPTIISAPYRRGFSTSPLYPSSRPGVASGRF